VTAPLQHSTTEAAANVSLRRAAETDVTALVEMVNAAYRKTEGHVFPGTTRTERVGLSKILPEITVSESAGRLVACVHITTTPPDGHFGLLAVDVALHGSGLGSLLISHAETLARAAGCTTMRIEAVKEGGRVPYYERRGYRVTAEHIGQEWNRGEDWGAAIEWHMVEMVKALS
jgi:GNAT superfamily N-acetyltransferase